MASTNLTNFGLNLSIWVWSLLKCIIPLSPTLRTNFKISCPLGDIHPAHSGGWIVPKIIFWPIFSHLVSKLISFWVIITDFEQVKFSGKIHVKTGHVILITTPWNSNRRKKFKFKNMSTLEAHNSAKLCSISSPKTILESPQFHFLFCETTDRRLKDCFLILKDLN